MIEQLNVPPPIDTPIAHLFKARDALNVRLQELGRQTAEADATSSEAGAGKDAKSQAILREFFEDAQRRELEVDHELADVCSTILTTPPTCASDLALKGKTVAFIAEQDHIWDWDKFKEELLIFAQQVADWGSRESAV